MTEREYPNTPKGTVSSGVISFIYKRLVDGALSAELKVLEGQDVLGRTDKLTKNIGNICNWGAGLIEDNYDVPDRTAIEAAHYDKIAATQEAALRKITSIAIANTGEKI